MELQTSEQLHATQAWPKPLYLPRGPAMRHASNKTEWRRRPSGHLKIAVFATAIAFFTVASALIAVSLFMRHI